MKLIKYEKVKFINVICKDGTYIEQGKHNCIGKEGMVCFSESEKTFKGKICGYFESFYQSYDKEIDERCMRTSFGDLKETENSFSLETDNHIYIFQKL